MKTTILILVVLGLSGCGVSQEATEAAPAAQVMRPNSDIVQTIVCDGRLDGWPLEFFYEAEVFATGYVFATGWVSNGSNQGSESLFYAPNQTGYDDAAIHFPLDVAGAPSLDVGKWVLSADRRSATALISYTDSDIGVISWDVSSSCAITRY